jgi:RNA polymerase subunit RPABC4/transcription elongation factor Spt4
MDLVKCTYCGCDMATGGNYCPNCGGSKTVKKSNWISVAYVLLFSIIAFICYVMLKARRLG